MKRTLVVNGETYDLENTKVVVTLTPDLQKIEVVPEEVWVEQERILDDVVGQEAEVVPVEPKAGKDGASGGFNLTGMGSENRASEEPREVADQPAKSGVLPYSGSPANVKRPLSESEVRLLNRTRKDLGVRTVGQQEIETRGYKNLKKNLELKSREFGSLTDEELRKAVHLLVLEEQANTRTDMRENLLAVETPPHLVVLEIADEKAGTGQFVFEETVSVYENPETLRTVQEKKKE